MDILSTWGPPLITIGTVLFIWRELRADIRDIGQRVSNLAERVAHIEGLLESRSPNPPSGE